MMSRKRMHRITAVLFLTGYLLFGNELKSQAVWENHTNEVYNFLYRMAQKGIIELDDNVRPLSRIYIETCLDSLSVKTSFLTKIEQKELVFYKQEYTDQSLNANAAPARFLQKDAVGRWRFLGINTDNFMLRMDPVVTAATIQGKNKNVMQNSASFSFYGYAGKHWGYYFSYNDVNERGTGIDTLRSFTPQPGIVTKISATKKSHNYSELRGGITYSFKNGSISFAQDQLLWGYGENGRIILSDKPPTYPFIRLDYKPLPWLSFHYMHAWLNSGIIDSARTYPTGTPGAPFNGQREFYIQKFMALHSIRFTPVKGLDIALGESIIYSDRLDVGYLIPVNFFKVYDNLVNNNNPNAGSNGQLFMQVSSRNHIPKTHVYGSLFIDEIRLGSIFDKTNSRNQLGATLGASITDIVLPYLTMGLEYTRINPFVYRNLIPAQNFTNSLYVMGDWMGNNSDRFIYTLRYTPAAKLKCLLRYQYIRKGGPGTLNQQYFQQPQPPFLFDLQAKQTDLELQVSYEWLNKLNLYGQFDSQHIRNYVSNTSVSDNFVTIGVRYGL